jgi:hypothetical protein
LKSLQHFIEKYNFVQPAAKPTVRRKRLPARLAAFVVENTAAEDDGTQVKSLEVF